MPKIRGKFLNGFKSHRVGTTLFWRGLIFRRVGAVTAKAWAPLSFNLNFGTTKNHFSP